MTIKKNHRSSIFPSWRQALLGSILIIPGFGTLAAQMTNIPELSSRPGAAYTIYLNVGGFDYDGLWHDHATSPDFTPAVNRTAATSSGAFNAGELDEIKKMWSRLAQSYTGLDVNVTTVDPAGTGMTDAQRQAFYDATPNMMHTVVGSQLRDSAPTTGSLTTNGKWYDNDADGVSPGIGVAAGNDPTMMGRHTNWMFSEVAADGTSFNGDYIGAVSAHENGHSFGLLHQGDFLGTNATPQNEYSNGDTNTGDGSYVPIMGNASGRQRVAWRDGTVHTFDETLGAEVQKQQNDVQTLIATNSIVGAMTDEYGDPTTRTGAVDLHFVDDGIGHTAATATDLSVNPDGTVNAMMALGIIVPLSESNPQALGPENYTNDFFKFSTDGVTPLTLTLNGLYLD